MKKLFTFLAFVTSLTIFAQAPQGFNYQATVRNNSGQLLLNQIVLVKFNILQNSTTGTTVYSETQTASTDDLGHISLVVGQGTATTGTFSTINWANGTYYLGIELNTGSGYVAMGTTQLFSVPYALYAQSSGSSQAPSLSTVLTVNNSANNTKIINLGDPVNLKDAVNKQYVDTKIPSGTNVGDVLTWNGTSWVASSAMLPTVSTTAITSITTTSSVSGGNVTLQGGSAVTARGICYSTSPNPTLSNSFTSNSAGTGTFTSNLTGLTPNTTYYVRAYATNSYGTNYGLQLTFTTLFAPLVSVGQSYQGGVVGYVYQPGDTGYVAGETHGIIASTADISNGIIWNNNSFNITTTTGNVLGTGLTNTNLIVSSLGNSFNYAAKICFDLVQGGYSDWFLPSWDELQKLYDNKSLIGGFTSNYYWSSSKEDDTGHIAFTLSFGVQNMQYVSGLNTNYVRAVRYF
jgi:hypothetical protein